jgi:hypothetical protein
MEIPIIINRAGTTGRTGGIMILPLLDIYYISKYSFSSIEVRVYKLKQSAASIQRDVANDMMFLTPRRKATNYECEGKHV